jgi:metal-responsive CopG/Arc/MetJ family transcriptional regulator
MNMNRTTIVADSDLLLELRGLAQRKGVSLSEVVRCALIEYAAKNSPRRRKWSFVGIGHSGGKLHLSRRHEEMLYAERRPRRRC